MLLLINEPMYLTVSITMTTHSWACSDLNPHTLYHNSNLGNSLRVTLCEHTLKTLQICDEYLMLKYVLYSSQLEAVRCPEL